METESAYKELEVKLEALNELKPHNNTLVRRPRNKV
jgi:hypothetical protein